MASVKDNLPRGGASTGMKGAMASITVAGGKAVFDTGLSVIHHVTWFANSQGGGYDFVNSERRPAYNLAYYNDPTVSNGIITLTGGLITDGVIAQFWVVGE